MMEWIKWVFDGIGTYILSAVVGLFSGFAGGFVSIKFTKVKQTQIARDGAQQNHAEHMNVYNISGITEERVREIINEQVQYALVGCTDEAYPKGRERISKFEDCYMSRIKSVNNAFQAFADPAFRILLRDALQSAASTDRETDYALLTELLVCYVQKGEDRIIRAAIHYAVKIVGEIDYKALCALTVAHAFMSFSPASGKCAEGLKVYNDIFRKLMYEELPTDSSWLDHLDVLNVIRVIPFSRVDTVDEHCMTHLNGYICVGIKKDSNDYKKALGLIDDYKIGQEIFVPNDFLDGYYRLYISSDNNIDRTSYHDDNADDDKWIELSEGQKSVLKQIWGMYSRDSNLFCQANQQFKQLWDSFDALYKFRQWWEIISPAFDITSVGRVLAQTNAKRCDPSIPDLI